MTREEQCRKMMAYLNVEAIHIPYTDSRYSNCTRFEKAENTFKVWENWVPRDWYGNAKEFDHERLEQLFDELTKRCQAKAREAVLQRLTEHEYRYHELDFLITTKKG